MTGTNDQDVRFLEVRITCLKDLVARKQMALFNAFVLLEPDVLQQGDMSDKEFKAAVSVAFYKFIDSLELKGTHPLFAG